jgi:hypothetical protein
MEMIKSKKGDGLSMNVIIIAILALLVLVVLTLIFVKQMDKTNTQAEGICLTQAIGAKCIDGATGTCAKYNLVDAKGTAFTDCNYNAGKKCCVPSTG